MANVQNLDLVIPYAIEDFIGIADEKQRPYFGVIGLISALRMLTEPGYRIPNACSNIAGSAGRTFSQILNDLLALCKCLRSVTDPHCSWRLSAPATVSS